MRTAALAVVALGLAACAAASSGSGIPATAPPTPAQAKPMRAPAGPAVDRHSDARPEVDGDVTQTQAAGVPILVKRVPSAEVFAVAVFVRGGADRWAPAAAGIEAVALGALADELENDVARGINVGAVFEARALEDVGELTGRGPLQSWTTLVDRLLEVFVDAEVDDEEFAYTRAHRLLAVRADRMDPHELLGRLTRQALFAGHVHAQPPGGTPETLAALTPAAVRAHLAQLRARRRLLVVAVGDVAADAVATRVQRWLGPLPEGAAAAPTTAPPAFTRPQLTIHAEGAPIPFLTSAFPVPGWASPDFPAALVALERLDAALHAELRARRALTYFQLATVTTARYAHAAGFTLAATDVSAAFTHARAALARLTATPLAAPELRGFQEIAITSFYRQRLTSAAIARALAYAQLRGGDWRLARVESRIRAVTAADVQRFLARYAVNLQTVIIGAPVDLDRAVFLRPDAPVNVE